MREEAPNLGGRCGNGGASGAGAGRGGRGISRTRVANGNGGFSTGRVCAGTGLFSEKTRVKTVCRRGRRQHCFEPNSVCSGSGSGGKSRVTAVNGGGLARARCGCVRRGLCRGRRRSVCADGFCVAAR